MPDYNLEMFRKDQDEMNPILKASENIELPLDEWPKINIGGHIYSLNPNNPESDIIGFFRTKYGQEKGADYAIRFLYIHLFIKYNHDALVKEELIKEDSSGTTLIREELLHVILDSFISPKPPAIFPTNLLGDKNNTFSFEKVLKAVKPLIKD